MHCNILVGACSIVVTFCPSSRSQDELLYHLGNAPYDDTGAFAGRIRVAVPRMGVGERSAATLALVVHELATNSLKHGALSVPQGTLDVSSTEDERELCLVWAEDGGPTLAESPDMRGFGSKLVARSISDQLNGEMSYDWQPSGLVATLRLRRDRLVA